MADSTPIKELLEDKDEFGDPQNNIILQRDKKPFDAISIPKNQLKNLLTTNGYFNQTKYQCSNHVGESLDITENDIVFNKNNREKYQFINGRALNIPAGLFLRTQLLSILNSGKKHFLYHIHNDINITPIASADKVRWFNPPKKIKGWADNIPDWNSYPNGTSLNEVHMEVDDMVSADHCQKGSNNFLITISPLKKYRKARDKRFSRRKTKGGKRKIKKKSRRRRKQKGGVIKFNDLKDGKTYDVTFSEEFVNDKNYEGMPRKMTNVLFEKMDQPDYFKLSFTHPKDGEKEEVTLHKINEYGIGKTAYATRKSGRPGVSASAGGRRKTKRKMKRKKSRKK